LQLAALQLHADADAGLNALHTPFGISDVLAVLIEVGTHNGVFDVNDWQQ
jgi:hypothetical protein